MFGEKKKKEEPRFVETMVPSKGGCFTRILVDTENGVQYLFAYLESGGLTVMVDEDGKPLINEAYRRKTESACRGQLPGGGCFFYQKMR